MATLPDFGFVGPTNIAASPVFDAQDSINLYLETGRGTSKSKAMLVGAPGLSLLGTLPTAPIRPGGLWSGNGRVFVCAGDHIYEMNNGAGVIHDYGAIPFSVGNGPVQFVSNGQQLFLMDHSIPSGGGISGGMVYIDSVGGGLIIPTLHVGGGTSSFQAGAITYLDGFIVAISSAPTDHNLIYVSDLLDGTSWQALNFVQRTGSEDLCTNLETLNEQLWIFGQKNIEVFYNAGNPTFPFARVAGASINVGLLGIFTVIKFQDRLMWLGSDSRGYARVYQTNSLQAEVVSTPEVEFLLSGLHAIKLLQSTAFGYEEAGHRFAVFNIDDPVGVGNTIVYDLDEKVWHRRTSATAPQVRARQSCFTSDSSFDSGFFTNYVGDYLTGAIYRQSITFPSDAGASRVYQRTAPHVADRNHFYKYPSLEIDADIGTAQIALSYSDDGGRTFPHTRAAMSGSAAVEFKRFKWWQLGRSRDRVFRATITDNANTIRLINAYLDARAGTET
jgi:hypothetical protein